MNVASENTYVILIISKHDGRFAWLGAKHDTREAAKAYAEKMVCARCNQYEIHPVPSDWLWISKERGFAPSREAA